MNTSITQSYQFHAAHTLHWHPGKCSMLHGHTYTFEIRIAGHLDANGVIVDFDDLRQTIEKSTLTLLDHTNLNDRFDSPTAEVICAWIFDQIALDYEGLVEVRLWETPDSSAVVSRE